MRKSLNNSMLMNFREWVLLREVNSQPWPQGYQIKLELHVKLEFPNGELYAPVDVNSGRQYEGKGLVCFDFDQTITGAHARDKNDPPKTNARGSTPEVNQEINKKMIQHNEVGNIIHILTARGTEEDKLRTDDRHPKGLQPLIGTGWDKEGRVQGFDTKIVNDPKWRQVAQLSPQNDVSFQGGVRHAHTDPKGPKIARLMKAKRCTWAILYDDGPANIKSCEEFQQLGWAIAGILVEPKYDDPWAVPKGGAIPMSASGQ